MQFRDRGEGKLDEVLDTPINSSLNELKEFKENTVWKDIKAELGRWLIDIHTHLELQDYGEGELRVLQGNAQTIRNCENVVDILIDIKTIQQEVKEDA